MRIEQKISLPLFIISISNFILYLMNDSGIVYLITSVGVYFVIGIFLLFKTIKISRNNISLLLIFASIMTLILDHPMSLSGISLFTFAMLTSGKKKRELFIYSIIVISIIVVRFSIQRIQMYETIKYLAGIYTILIAYFEFIHPKEEPALKPVIVNNPQGVKTVVLDILRLKVQGYDWPEINVKLELCITDERVVRVVRDERKRLGFKSQEEFIFWLSDSGILKSKSGFSPK